MMINLFDLSAGMAGIKLLTDRSSRDGSPVRRNRPDTKRTADPSGANADDKLESKKAGGTPMKMLIAKEMSKETESTKRKPPSVVARLMGLEDDPPSPQSILSSGRSSNRDHPPSKETVEYKDVYEVQQQPQRTNHCRDQRRGRILESKNDRRMDLVRQKFMDAKRLATDEKLLRSREFQDALEVLSSNRDLFLEFLEEPNSIFAKQISELHSITLPCHTKRITVLKPLRSVDAEGGNKSKVQRVNASRSEMSKPHHSRSFPHLKVENFSQPTRIVVLKPGPGNGNPDCVKAKVSPPAISSELIEQNDCGGGMKDNEVAKICLRRDESLLSSVYSNGYGGGESSFNRSEHEYIEEEGGGFTNPEMASPISHHSWDYINRFGNPILVSSVSRASYSPEPLVTIEAQKRLSERWALVASVEDSQEQLQVPSNWSTLGEMLAVREAKKEGIEDGGLTFSGSRYCGMEDESSRHSACLSVGRKADGEKECSPRNLSRSKSVPTSSSVYDNIGLDLQSSSSQDTAKPKEKSSFRGKVSSFFFSTSKKHGKEKLSCSLVGSGGKVKTLPSAEVSGNTSVSRSERSPEEKFEENLEISASLVSGSALKQVTLSLERPASSDYWSENPDKIRSSDENARTNRDQPSPTSVLDVPFEDVNHSGQQSSAGNLQPLSRCPTIESLACSLSWEDAHPELPTTLSSKVVDEELDHYFFVQKLLSSSGLGNRKYTEAFVGWHSLEFPLSPMLLDKFLDRKGEAAKCRERRSNQRLLFDCVNAALLEIGQTTIRSIYPWPQVHADAKKDPSPCALQADVWSLVKDRFFKDGKIVGVENDSVSLVVERVVTKEVQGRGWAESMRLEEDEMGERISEQVLEELVGDALAYLAVECL